VFNLAGTIADDTQKMNSWGLSDVIYMALENEKEKKEHEREMQKLKEVNKYQTMQQVNNTANTSSSNLLDNDLIKYGGVVVAALVAYKLLM
jgi:hypothetical protein